MTRHHSLSQKALHRLCQQLPGSLAASRNVSSFPAVHEMSPQRPSTEMSAIMPIFHSAHLHFPPFKTLRLPSGPVSTSSEAAVCRGGWTKVTQF